MDIETYAILKNKLDIEKDRVDNLDNANLDLKTVVKSKNLFDGHFEKGYLSSLNGSKVDITTNKTARTKYFVAIDDGVENITLQRINESLISNITAIAYDADKNFIKKLELKRFKVDNKLCHNIALTSDVRFIKVAFVIPNDKISDDYLDYFESINFQIENGLEATEYEKHKLFVKKECVESLEELTKRVEALEALINK